MYLDGYHGDTSVTFLLPETDKLGRELIEVTKEALEVGIRACGPGKQFKDIGREIQYVTCSIIPGCRGVPSIGQGLWNKDEVEGIIADGNFLGSLRKSTSFR